MVVRDRQQVIDDGEPPEGSIVDGFDIAVTRRCDARIAQRAAAEPRAARAVGLPLVAAVVEVVDSADINEDLEPQLRRVTQRGADGDEVGRIDAVAKLTRAGG
jgi:hypothetical protein